jgi:HPt (histidine-containing phosphotransfer) domain-containing protein
VSDDLLAEALAVLRAEYAAELPGLSRALAERVHAALRDVAALPPARAAAHRLAGTAGSYGFADVSAAASRIEVALDEVCARGGSCRDAERDGLLAALGDVERAAGGG